MLQHIFIAEENRVAPNYQFISLPALEGTSAADSLCGTKSLISNQVRLLY